MTRHSLSRASLRTLALGVATAATLGVALPATADAQAIDQLGRPTEPVLGSMESTANMPWVPEDVRQGIEALVGFYRGGGEGGVPIPQNGPAITQFPYPTVMPNCIDGKQTAVGTAMAIPGPAPLPVPGIPEHQVGFVFTALGTEKVSPVQTQPMAVEWLNVNNGRRGTTPLGFHGVNPDGPATVNGTADTGPGTVLMLLQGGVTTTLKDGASANCAVTPMVGSVVVG